MHSKESEMWVGGIFAVVTGLLIFSVDIPLGLGVSQYASINTEDFAVLLAFLLAVKKIVIDGRSTITTSLVELTTAFLIASAWMVVTLGFAIFRSPDPVLVSSLWVLKWFEVLVFFLCLQALMNRQAVEVVFRTTMLSGVFLAIYAVFASQVLGVWRPRFFFHNPNSLAVFFTLIIAITFGRAPLAKGWTKIAYVGSGLIGIAGVLATLSRTGLIGTIVVVTVLLVLRRNDISARDYMLMATGGSAAIVIGVVALQDKVLRFVSWIQISESGISLAEGSASKSFRVRLQLIEKSIDLFQQNPVFGYGWFASPSRVGYLDNLYSILLVELGLPGALITAGVFAITIRTLARRYIQSHAVDAGAILAWFVALLLMGVGGPFIRSPHMMMVWVLMVVAASFDIGTGLS